MKLVATEKLVPYVNNARTHSAEQIMKLRSSLREFGFINPIIIDKDYNIIAGHGRLMAAKDEGIREVPCVFVDYLTEAQKKAYILADNRMALDAGWDEELLKVEIEALQAEDFDLGLTGFDEKELASFLMPIMMFTKMILMWMRNLRNRLSQKLGMCGYLVAIALFAVTAQRKKHTQRS